MPGRTTEDIIALLDGQFAAFGNALNKHADATNSLSTRMAALEQTVASAGKSGGGGRMFAAGGQRRWGDQVVGNDRFKAWIEGGKAGSVRIPIKAEITTPTGIEQRDFVAPMRDRIQGLPQMQLTVRDLLNVVPTSSNKIDFVRQTSRTIRAAGVADGAEKPQSDLGFELAEAPVRTIAHWLPCPRQTMDDVADLGALINSELVFGLRQVEEEQLLAGDGTGQNILGLIPQALAYAPPFSVAHENPLDRILLALVQAQQSRLPADGVVVNDTTWAALIATKDDEGRYIGAGAFGVAVQGLLWQVNVVPTPSMAPNEALVGCFRLGARLYDRLEPEVLISSEDRDNFIKNMLTVRAEERVAMAVRVPQAFVHVPDLGVQLTG